MELEQLQGKTIKTIECPGELEMLMDSGEDTITRFDDNYVITFTDGTILKLASWDYEGYSSGIDIDIIEPK